jgi:hypothetical protein
MKIGSILLLGIGILALSKKSDNVASGTVIDTGSAVVDTSGMTQFQAGTTAEQVTLSDGTTGIKFLRDAGLQAGQSYQPDIQGSLASVDPHTLAVQPFGEERYGYNKSTGILTSDTGESVHATLTDVANLLISTGNTAAGNEILQGIHYNDTGFLRGNFNIIAFN